MAITGHKNEQSLADYDDFDLRIIYILVRS